MDKVEEERRGGTGWPSTYAYPGYNTAESSGNCDWSGRDRVVGALVRYHGLFRGLVDAEVEARADAVSR